MRLAGWLALAAALAVAVAAGFVAEFSGDFHWHVVLGDHVLDHGALYASDLHSHTAHGQAMFNTSWLGDVVYAVAFRAGGWPGAYLLRALVLVAMVLCLCREATRRGVDLAVAATLTLVVLAQSFFVFYLRPETMAFALLAGLLATLGAHERSGGRRHLAIAIALLALWANVHGSVGIGVMVLGCYAGERFVRVLLGDRDPRRLVGFAAVPVLGFAAACANPHGVWLPLAFTRVQQAHTATIREYAQVTAATITPLLLAALLAVVATTAAALVLRRRTSLWLAAAWLVLAFFTHRYQRFATYAMVLAVPLLAGNLALIAEAARDRSSRVAWRRLGHGLTAAVALWALLVVAVERRAFAHVGTGIDAASPMFPIAACEFIAREVPPVPLLNSYDLGGYLMYCLGPDYPVFIDQRGQSLYGDAFYRRYLAAQRSPAALARLLADYPAPLAVVGRDGLAGLLSADRDRWRLVWIDDKALVFADRRDPRTAGVAVEHGFEHLDPSRLGILARTPRAALADARAELERQRRRCPGCVRTLLLTAAVAIADGDDPTFVSARDRLLERGETPDVALLGGIHALDRGAPDRAVVLFARFAGLGGDPVAAAVWSARALAAAGRPDDAGRLLDAAAAELPAARPVLERARREITD